MYLKKEREERIKGEGCDGRQSQQSYTERIEITSLEAIMLTCMIDAFERRDVASINKPGAFSQTKMPKGEEDMNVIIDDSIAKVLAKLATKTYQEYMHRRRIEAYISCRAKVEISWTLKAALLFWNNFPVASSNEDTSLICMTGVLPIRILMENNAPLSGTWMI